MNWFSMSKNQRLEEILAGNPNQWSNFTATDFQNFLSSFLLPSSDYQGLLAELKRLGPRQVCQYQVNNFISHFYSLFYSNSSTVQTK